MNRFKLHLGQTSFFLNPHNISISLPTGVSQLLYYLLRNAHLHNNMEEQHTLYCTCIIAEHLSARQLIVHLKLLCICMSVRPSSIHPSVTIKGTVGDDTYTCMGLSSKWDSFLSITTFPLCGCLPHAYFLYTKTYTKQ